jgi:hypothetical protein
MSFNSFEFFSFLPILVLCYFLLPNRFCWGILLIASYYFFMSWEPEYAILIFVSTLNYKLENFRFKTVDGHHLLPKSAI